MSPVHRPVPRGTPRGWALLVLAAGLLRAAPPAAAQAPAPAISLSEAVSRALASRPELARGTGAVRAARAAERAAVGAYLPSLAVETNAMRATTPSPVAQPGAAGGAADRTAAVGLTSAIDVFTAGRRGAERRRAGAESEQSEAALVAARFAVVLDTKRRFFDVVRGAELRRVAAARVERATEGLAAAALRHRVGVATGSDELRARLELTNARQELLQAEAARRTATFALARAVGMDGAVEAQPPDSLAPAPLPLADDALLAEIARATPSVRAAASAELAAEAGVDVAHARYAPTVQLTGGYRWLAQRGAAAPATGAADGAPLWGLRLGMSYALFDGWQREQVVERAAAERDAAAAELADSRRLARAEAERVLAALHVAEERIALAEEGVQVAREDLRVVSARYRAGAAAILDRITSQLNLATAETTLVAVRHDYQVARAELEALVGREL